MESSEVRYVRAILRECDDDAEAEADKGVRNAALSYARRLLSARVVSGVVGAVSAVACIRYGVAQSRTVLSADRVLAAAEDVAQNAAKIAGKLESMCEHWNDYTRAEDRSPEAIKAFSDFWCAERCVYAWVTGETTEPRDTITRADGVERALGEWDQHLGEPSMQELASIFGHSGCTREGIEGFADSIAAAGKGAEDEEELVPEPADEPKPKIPRPPPVSRTKARKEITAEGIAEDQKRLAEIRAAIEAGRKGAEEEGEQVPKLSKMNAIYAEYIKGLNAEKAALQRKQAELEPTEEELEPEPEPMEEERKPKPMIPPPPPAPRTKARKEKGDIEKDKARLAEIRAAIEAGHVPEPKEATRAVPTREEGVKPPVAPIGCAHKKCGKDKERKSEPEFVPESMGEPVHEPEPTPPPKKAGPPPPPKTTYAEYLEGLKSERDTLKELRAQRERREKEADARARQAVMESQEKLRKQAEIREQLARDKGAKRAEAVPEEVSSAAGLGRAPPCEGGACEGRAPPLVPTSLPDVPIQSQPKATEQFSSLIGKA